MKLCITIAWLALIVLTGCQFNPEALVDCSSDADCNANSRCDLELGVCVRVTNIIEGDCGDSTCTFGEICCDEMCVSSDSDDNCGACGVVCGSNSSCTNRMCRCDVGFLDCDADPTTCETDTSTEENCGGVG